MKQQSAVQWLVEQLTYENGFAARLTSFNGDSNVSEIVEQAKQMEWEQLSNTWTDSRVEDQGDDYIGEQMTFEQYYNETFNK